IRGVGRDEGVVLVGANDGFDRSRDVWSADHNRAAGSRRRIVFGNHTGDCADGSSDSARSDWAYVYGVISAIIGDGDRAPGVKDEVIVSQPSVDLVVPSSDGSDGVIATATQHDVNAMTARDGVVSTLPIQACLPGKGGGIDEVGARTAGHGRLLDADQGHGASHRAGQCRVGEMKIGICRDDNGITRATSAIEADWHREDTGAVVESERIRLVYGAGESHGHRG